MPLGLKSEKMISLIYKIYSKKFSNELLDQYFYRLIIWVANYFLPIYFRMTGWAVKKLDSRKVLNKTLIVSLTSFPARINKVWLTIETILRQKEKPNQIFLWLYKDEFKGKTSLPQNLLRLEKRGLEIRFCDENLKSHLKYYYSMLLNPEANIVVVDDDMIYPSDLIEKLKLFHVKYPQAIISTMSRKIEVLNFNIKPYNDWEYIKENTPPSFSTLLMGCGSTFYPSSPFIREVFNTKAIKEIALSADDLWLQIMSVKSNRKIVCIAGEYKRLFFIPVKRKNNINLMDINMREGRNDVILEKLINNYQISLSVFTK
ncbi:MAG: hypothetical protein GX180_02490 [Enterococcus sp.]|nr:hypothetical protein [Enterococcus sp.]